MAISYTATLNDGAVGVSAANWSDATGFGAANPKLLIAEATQTISAGLDQTAASAVDLIHIIGGTPRIVGTANEALNYKPDNTYSTEPNLVWRASGGVLHIKFDTNEANLVVLAGSGDVFIHDGAIVRLVCDGPNVTVAGAADITTELIVNSGSVYVESSSDTIPTYRQGGGACYMRRRIETTAHMNGGRLKNYNITGSSTGTLNINGGILVPESGDIATINRNGGVFDLDGAKRAVALGGTAITNYGPDAMPSSRGLVTIGGGTTVDYATHTGNTFAVPGGR